MGAAYSFRSSWDVEAPQERVREVLGDLARYPTWWPQVRAVATLGQDERGRDGARVLARSTLPYTLDLLLREVPRDDGVLETAIDGDLVGTARWRLRATETGTHLDYEQDVVVAGWLGRLTPLLRPVLSWNHARMMAGCRAGLAQTLA